MTQATKQNAPYGYYELGLRADMLEVELKAACQACTHLDEKLKEAEAECVRANDSARARDERAARRIDELETQLAETRERLEAHRQNLAAANEWGARAEAKLQAVEALLKKPGAWSEWARECLAVLGGGK